MVPYSRLQFFGIPIWGVFWFFFTLIWITPTETFSAKTIPDQPALIEIVEETMLDFALAVKAEDFTVFYRRISKLWQDQTTKEQLLNLFKSFSDKKIDLILLEGKTPDFYKKPLIDDNGWLVLQGKYEAFPYYVDFILSYTYEDTAWRLAGINVETSPMPDSKPKPGEMPTDSLMKQMAQETMLNFAVAVHARDFSAFYSKISRAWQKQVTKEKMEATFKPFSDNNIDLTVLKDYAPTFTEKPTISGEGILFIKGKYELSQGEVLFAHKYVYEASVWRLLGINVNIESKAASKPEPGSIPKGPEMEALVQQTMLDFAQAVKSKDFSAFYESIAEIWKNQSSRDEFAKIFKSFTDKNIDLTGLRTLEPVFEKSPYLDSNGLLRIKGLYATEPSKTAFTLKYFLENESWKLVGINIKMK